MKPRVGFSSFAAGCAARILEFMMHGRRVVSTRTATSCSLLSNCELNPASMGCVALEERLTAAPTFSLVSKRNKLLSKVSTSCTELWNCGCLLPRLNVTSCTCRCWVTVQGEWPVGLIYHCGGVVCLRRTIDTLFHEQLSLTSGPDMPRLSANLAARQPPDLAVEGHHGTVLVANAIHSLQQKDVFEHAFQGVLSVAVL